MALQEHQEWLITALSKAGFGSKLSETYFSIRHECSKIKIKPSLLLRQDTDPYNFRILTN
jgi:hypothetical protein